MIDDEKNYVSLNENEEYELEDINTNSIDNVDKVKIKGATGTVMSSIITLSNTLLGSGMLAMPSAFAAVGMCFGIGNIIVFGSAALFGLWLMTRCATYTGRNSSFFSLSMITYPQAAAWFDLAISIKCFGVSVSYLVIIGGLMPKVVLGIFSSISPDSIFLTREFWITIGTLCIVPMAFMKKLDSLKYTSLISLLAIVYLLFIVVFYYFVPMDESEIVKNAKNEPIQLYPEIKYFVFSMNFLKNLPIYVFAFTCHQNLFSVYNEMKNNNQKKVNKVISYSIYFGMIMYWTVGILGYLTFGANTDSNIISMYPSSSTLILLGQISIVVMVCLSYPLQLHPCRLSLDKVLIIIRRYINRKSNDHVSIENTPTSSLINNAEMNMNGIANQVIVKPMTDKKFFIMTLGILVVSYIIACSVETLGIVLSVVGATGSTMICYILPGLLYYKLRIDEIKMNRSKKDICFYGAIFMFVLGIILMAVCLTSIFLSDD